MFLRGMYYGFIKRLLNVEQNFTKFMILCGSGE